MKAFRKQDPETNSELSLLTKGMLTIKKHKLDLNQKKLHLYFLKKTKADILEFTVRRIDQPDQNEQEEQEAKVTDETLKILARVIRSSNKIHTLKIDCSQCSEITSQGLQYLSESIRGLTSLKHLNLNFKRCDKLISTGLSHLHQALKTLTSLQNITLRFEGEDESKIGDWELSMLGFSLQELPSLRKIHLEFTSFRGITNIGIRSLSKYLSRLLLLQALHLQFEGPVYDNWWMEIDSAGIQILSQNLKKLTSLQTIGLNFSHCKKICDKGLHDLAQTLRTFSSLQKLDLNFAMCLGVTQGGVDIIYQSLEKLTSLLNLRLSFLGSTYAGIENFGRILKPLSSSLRILHHDFSGSKEITDTGMQNLGDALKSLSSLESITLSFFYLRTISDAGIHQLSQGFTQLPLLKYINLRFPFCKGISDEGIKSLCLSLAKLKFLQSLNLDFEYWNKITDTGVRYLSETLKSLPSSLRNINFIFEGCDSITKTGISELSQALSQLTLLQSLHLGLGQCSRVQRGIHALGQALKSLTCLQSFSMKCEDLEDDELSSLSEGFKSLVSLREIDITAYLYDASDECIESFAGTLGDLPVLQSICFSFSTCEDPREDVRNIIYQALKKLPCLKALGIDLKD